jgi:hypothetical protein
MHRDKSGDLQVDADIFNSNGDHEPVAHIERNEFHLISRNFTYRDDSPDRSTLRIHGFQFEEILFIRFLNPHALKIRGLFYAPHHPFGIFVGDTETQTIDPDGSRSAGSLTDNCAGHKVLPSAPASFLVEKRGLFDFDWDAISN